MRYKGLKNHKLIILKSWTGQCFCGKFTTTALSKKGIIDAYAEHLKECQKTLEHEKPESLTI